MRGRSAHPGQRIGAILTVRQRRAGHLDHDLSQRLSCRVVPVGVDRLREREDPIDDRTQPGDRDGPIHLEELRAAADRHRTNGGSRLEQQPGIQCGRGAPDESDQRHLSPDGRGAQRWRQVADDIDEPIRPAARGQFAHPGRPIGLDPIVHDLIGAEVAQLSRFVGAAGGRDDASATNLGELDREERHPTGAQRDYRVAGHHAGEGVPCGHTGAGQGGSLGERQMVRHRHQRRLRQHDQFGEHPVQRATQLREVFRSEGTVLPRRKQRRRDTIADLDTADAGAGRDDLAGAVGHRHELRFDRQCVPALQDQQFAIAQRHGTYRDEHLTRAWLRRRTLPQRQPFHSQAGGRAPATHRQPPTLFRSWDRSFARCGAPPIPSRE
ncbi:hypothetical protein GCM10010168_71140 [Actinoplanes ianthinogenes]|uniref:Uncharacterized protein n=1 Tax=Actinoplanes ianthinogenes TaxID=122358 RepID=A0ABN6CSU6_9ACTN|nr:hypothetical protein Aiant_79540 [Actinoplanes ianthinogenes]GGR42166.1 hypothetical protein GCM10010168_71140 [Actinoplanes ianthinogenes]